MREGDRPGAVDGIVVHASGAVTITGGGIDYYKLCAIKGALKLELAGMRASRGRTAYAAAKADYGLKGSRPNVLAQLERMVAECQLKRGPIASMEPLRGTRKG
jgi:hypothetical protein